MNPAPPKIRVTEVLARLVAKPVPDVVADESRRKISRRPVTVGYRRRAGQQLSQSSMQRGVGFLGLFARGDVAPRPYDLHRFAMNASNQALRGIHPAIGAVPSAAARPHRPGR